MLVCTIVYPLDTGTWYVSITGMTIIQARYASYVIPVLEDGTSTCFLNTVLNLVLVQKELPDGVIARY